jgi:drug/metabolite transporter (DMT)-like permease
MLASNTVPGAVFALILFAAFLSASWNASVKGSSDKYLQAVLVASGAAFIALFLLPFLRQPAPASWIYIGGSALLQVLYYYLLVAAFRAGDFGHAYPLMRGTAPLLVSLVSGPVIGEALSLGRWLGVALICSGVMGLAWEARSHVGANSAVMKYALSNAVVIAAYTTVDGIGVRASGAPASYTMWIFEVTALVLLFAALLTRPRELWRYAPGRLRSALIGGVAALTSYEIALWAMTQVPIAVVAALRETSMLFGLAISVLVLKERGGARRYAATALIACGAIAIRLF